MTDYEKVCKRLLANNKGSGYISTIRRSIDESTDLKSLKTALISNGMFPGSADIWCDPDCPY